MRHALLVGTVAQTLRTAADLLETQSGIDPEKVRTWMVGRGLETALEPTLPVTSVILKRVRLMTEELSETVEAMDNDDLVKIADGLGDLLYVVIGTALVYGIPIAAVFDEVHRSNMSKSGLTAEQKGGKGAGFEPPQLEAILWPQRDAA